MSQRRQIILAAVLALVAIAGGATSLYLASRPDPEPAVEASAPAVEWQPYQGTIFVCDGSGKPLTQMPVAKIMTGPFGVRTHNPESQFGGGCNYVSRCPVPSLTMVEDITFAKPGSDAIFYAENGVLTASSKFKINQDGYLEYQC